MKTTLLNKYFRLIEKGIKITVFELDRQSEENRELLEKAIGSQIYTRNIQEYNHFKKNRKVLAKKIFHKG